MSNGLPVDPQNQQQPPANPPANPPTPDNSSAAEIADLKAQVETLTNTLTNWGKEMQGYVQTVESRLPQEPNPNPPANPAGGNDDTNRILEDPKGFVNEQIQAGLKDTLGGYLAQDVQDKHTTLVNEHRQSIDAKYGEGFFDANLKAEMDKVFEAQPPQARGQRATYEAVLNQVRGTPEMMEKMTTAAAETAKAAEEAKVQNDQTMPPLLLGDGRPAAPKPAFDVADREHLTNFTKATGQKVDEARILDVMNVRRETGGPVSVDDYPMPEKTPSNPQGAA